MNDKRKVYTSETEINCEESPEVLVGKVTHKDLDTAIINIT
jgi:hypothetical protein